MNEHPAAEVLRLHDVLLLLRRPEGSSGFAAKIVEASRDASAGERHRAPSMASPPSMAEAGC